MDRVDFLLLVLLTACVGGAAFGGYRYGRYMERGDLTDALIHQMEGIYYDGYGDAEKACRMGGIK